MKYKLISITAIFSLLVVAGSAFYYFVIYPPIHEKQLQELEQVRVINLNQCKEDSDAYFVELWNRECASHGLEKDCEALPTDVVDTINSYSKENLDACHLKYPQIR